MGSFIMTERQEKVKKSFILSGLVGTGGFFIAKLIGLVYAIPFSSILASDAYMSYYGTAYRIYSYILNIFTAGIPFAISALIAKYWTKKDFKSVLKLKNISLQVLGFTGLCGMIIMIISSFGVAPLIAAPEDISLVRNVLMLLSLAVLFVPILSAYRGYYQGQKEITQYAFSQSFEQLFRVGFLLGFSCLAVYGLNLDRKWALYIAVLSTSVAAVAGIVQYIIFDNKKAPAIRAQAKVQTEKSQKKDALRKELITLAIPYLILAVLGYSDDIVYSVVVPIGLRVHGYAQEAINTILSSFNYVGTKMNAIPMILAPGFIAALIPHITEATTEGDYAKVKRNILDCINTVMYIALPVVICIMLYATGIYHTLFYTDNFELSVQALRWIAVEGLLSTISPLVSNMMLALGAKKSSTRRLTIMVVAKLILMVPFIYVFGFRGVVISTTIGVAYVVFGNLLEISKKFGVSYRESIIEIGKIIIGCICMSVVCVLLQKVGLGFVDGSKLVCFVKMVLNAALSVGTYLLVTWLMHAPQEIFHMNK